MEDSFSKQRMRWRTLPMRWRTHWEVVDSVPGIEACFLLETAFICITFIYLLNFIMPCYIIFLRCLHCSLQFQTDNLRSTWIKSDSILTYLMCLTGTVFMLYWCSTVALANTLSSEIQYDGKMFFITTVEIILLSHSSTRITTIVLGIKICIPTNTN